MRLVCVSDTHGQGHRLAVPDGDILVHAGDLTGIGTLEQITKEADWLRSLPHPHKVVVAGNHDFGFELEAPKARALMDGLVYLEDEAAVVAGLRFYGAPWQPGSLYWAFNLKPGPPIKARWDLIPAGIDVLVTHGPPAGICDRTIAGTLAGCADLLDAVRRVRPKVHVFGHIHEAWGASEIDGTRFVNASVCDPHYEVVRPPLVVEL